MATLAFSVAGQALGGLVGGPFGATVGRALGALAGSALDSALFAGDRPAPAATGYDIRLQSASEGGAIPRIYGWNRVTGNIIWATELERFTPHDSGAKGTGHTDREATITANFAVGLCEGEVTHIGRIWADGEVLETEGLNIRFYPGAETQQADSLIAAKQGADNAPAYRGTAYLVFERLPLTDFGNRIPNISVELCRSSGDLENAVRAVTVIPAATEFGYDPKPRVRIVGPGAVASENAHLSTGASDWSLSIDELQAMCPNLEHVALVIAWFGDDLRCGNCTVKPRVVGADRVVRGTEWVVNGLARGDVPVVSMHQGMPAYGGTPSDGAVLAAIADLKARGLKVTLYPMLLMDVAAGNTLSDPYTGEAGQPVYPWRGRITCDPAPGVSGSPEMTAAIAAPMAAFLGSAEAGDFAASGSTIVYSGPVDWGYRRMLLHYAHLCAAAGGVDAFLIGSELRGLTSLRRAADAFPFVEGLVDLAADIRGIVGADTNITYAADWSEYSGFQPPEAPGDKLFHLDPLWASPDIDAVGIDNYMPLSDWRDSDGPDAALAASDHDLGYLMGNITGGEGFDWFYASEADRIAGTRSPITDGAYDEPWTWRVKDLKGWWENRHFNRIGGVRAANPTAWQAEMKPIWLTELGCPAVDKGANQPNVFPDPKSSENAVPYFSSGAPDTLIQRQFLRAHGQFWRPDAPDFIDTNNPVSSVYGDRMLDPDRIYLWTWDARPYPAFPNLRDVWADGGNYATGHWLTGRLGAMSVAELIAAVAKDYGMEIAAGFSGGLKVHGMQIGAVTTMRDAVGPLLQAADLQIVAGADGLVAARTGDVVATVSADERVDDGHVAVSRKRPDASEAVGRLALTYLDRNDAYRSGTATAVALSGDAGSALNSGLVVDTASARIAAERMLANARMAGDTLELALPNAMLALEAGDVIEVEGQTDGPFLITELRDATYRRVTARAVSGQTGYAVFDTERSGADAGVPAIGAPLVMAAHLPAAQGTLAPSRLTIGAVCKPWPGEVTVTAADTGSTLARLTKAATLGELTAPLRIANAPLWDRRNAIALKIYDGHLSSVSRSAALAGDNRLAVQKADAHWEIIGFSDAELTGDGEYRLTGLLRGLMGTGDAMTEIPSGARVMVLDGAVAEVGVNAEWLGGTFDLLAFAGSKDSEGTAASAQTDIDPLLALAPCHLAATRDASTGDVTLSWVRRGRLNGNSWALAEIPMDPSPEAYRVEIHDGERRVRCVAATEPTIVYPATEQTADFGALPSSFSFTVAQTSPTLGAGHVATGDFNG